MNQLFDWSVIMMSRLNISFRYTQREAVEVRVIY